MKGYGNIIKKHIDLYAIEAAVGEVRSSRSFRIGLLIESKLG